MESIRTKDCAKINTKDGDGNPNGWILEILSSENERGFMGQIYLCVVSVGAFKGYHLHTNANYYVTCIKGKIREWIGKDLNIS